MQKSQRGGGSMGADVNQELKLYENAKKSVGWGGDGCEPRNEVILKMLKNVGGGGGGWGIWGGGCEPRIKVILKMQKSHGCGERVRWGWGM